jgi:hypothetical protein
VNPLDSSIPTVGQLVTAHEGVVMATFTCRCEPTNTPLLLRGHDMGHICRRCGNIYGILKVTFDRARGDVGPAVMIGLVGRQPMSERIDEALAVAKASKNQPPES